ncbi:MAG: hypothetical protein VB131_04175 [Burkholderia gladioli]
METIKHTRGPWRAEAWSCHAATSVLVDDASIVTGKRVIAECETEEDAHLVAASPDLASALHLVASKTVLTSGIRAVVDAALAKAGYHAPEPVRHFTIAGGAL